MSSFMAAWVLVGALSAPQPQASTPTAARYWYSGGGLVPFRDGYRAWELGDWKTAEATMRKALEEEPDQPAGQVKTGGAGWITPYIPSYYLCLAQCRLGNRCENVDKVLDLIKDSDSQLLKWQKSACRTSP
jgi:hypothetical protein